MTAIGVGLRRQPYCLSEKPFFIVQDLTAFPTLHNEIGVILDLSPRTVQKHLEHIYRKIYVESRTAAAPKAYEIASMATNQTVGH